MELRSGVIVWLDAPLLVLGESLRCTDEVNNVMVTRVVVNSFLSIPIQFQFGAKCELVNSNSIQFI